MFIIRNITVNGCYAIVCEPCLPVNSVPLTKLNRTPKIKDNKTKINVDTLLQSGVHDNRTFKDENLRNENSF